MNSAVYTDDLMRSARTSRPGDGTAHNVSLTHPTGHPEHQARLHATEDIPVHGVHEETGTQDALPAGREEAAEAVAIPDDIQTRIAQAARAAVEAGRDVNDDDETSDDIQLPSQYAEALMLAESMLAAARKADWETVKRLRTALPKLAADLEVAWQELRTVYPDACALLEGARVKMIREILRVDEQIRRQAASPAWQRVQPMLDTRPMVRPAQEASLAQRV